MSTMKQFKYKHRHRLICTDRPFADLNEWKARELKYLLNSMKLKWNCATAARSRESRAWSNSTLPEWGEVSQNRECMGTPVSAALGKILWHKILQPSSSSPCSRGGGRAFLLVVPAARPSQWRLWGEMVVQNFIINRWGQPSDTRWGSNLNGHHTWRAVAICCDWNIFHLFTNISVENEIF